MKNGSYLLHFIDPRTVSQLVKHPLMSFSSMKLSRFNLFVKIKSANSESQSDKAYSITVI